MHFEDICGLKTELNYPFNPDWIFTKWITSNVFAEYPGVKYVQTINHALYHSSLYMAFKWLNRQGCYYIRDNTPPHTHTHTHTHTHI